MSLSIEWKFEIDPSKNPKEITRKVVFASPEGTYVPRDLSPERGQAGVVLLQRPGIKDTSPKAFGGAKGCGLTLEVLKKDRTK